MQERLEELDAEKAAGIRMVGNRNANAAEDDTYLQNLFSQYAQDGENGIKIVSKVNTYLACQSALSHWKGLEGKEN